MLSCAAATPTISGCEEYSARGCRLNAYPDGESPVAAADAARLACTVHTCTFSHTSVVYEGFELIIFDGYTITGDY
jgi:hypothetical protein